METPYGGLWYAAGNLDGFRFGAVNRPSPPRAIYRYQNNAAQMKLNKTRHEKCLKTGRPSNRKTVLFRPPAAHHSPLALPRRHWGPRFCGLGLPTPLLSSWLSVGCAGARADAICSARLCVRLIVLLLRMGKMGPPVSLSCGAIVVVGPSPF